MAKNAPVSSVPQLKGVIIPEIVETVKVVDHFVVGGEAFLVKSRATREAKKRGLSVGSSSDTLPVFEVGTDNFITLDEAEKKLKSVVKKHRDKVRDGARLFGVDKASWAEKNIALKWLLETYELSELFDVLDVPNLFCKNGPYKEFGLVEPVNNYFFSKRPSLFRRDYLRTVSGGSTLETDVKHWSWLQNRSFDDHWGFPKECKGNKHLFNVWHEKEKLFIEKIALIKRLIDERFLELLFIDGSAGDAAGNVIPFRKLVEDLNLELIANEVQDLYDVMNQAELGTDLEITFKSGEVVYAVNGDSKLGAPFKRF